MGQKDTEIKGVLLQHLFAYWDSRRKGSEIPTRADIDPVHIPRLLPHVFLVDVERNGELRFRIRLAGTYIETALRRFAGGLYLDDIKLDSEAADIVARYRECVETRQPVLSRHVFVTEESRKFAYDRLLLPLALADPRRVDMILGGICFEAPMPTPSILFSPTPAERTGKQRIEA